MDAAEPDVAAWRRDYARAVLAEGDLDPDPFRQFARWLADAVAAGLPEPNAVVLATADPEGQPSARTVLLKGCDERGFAFFTNLDSRKGRELAANPRASLCFPWIAMERQVVVVGAVEPVDRAEAGAYFASRPYGSRLGAWASRQSSVLPSRDLLEQRYEELARRFPEDAGVPLPDFWGGFRVVPATVEFWQGRTSRLHDRLRYRRTAGTASDTISTATSGHWRVERLSP